MRCAERVSPVVSVTSAKISYWKIGSSFSATERSGLAMNWILKVPSACVSALPCVISCEPDCGARHQKHQYHQSG